MENYREDLVTVIVPIYNTQQYLDDCVKSICNQTYKELEILLIDDGSKDDSGKLADAWTKKDVRCKVFHKKNTGLSATRNFGILRAKGEFLLFVDSDDILEQNMIERLHQEAMEEKVDIVCCGIKKRRDTDDEMQYQVPSRIYTLTDYLYEMYLGKHKTKEDDMFLPLVAAWNKLYRASLFSDIKYPEGRIHEDNAIIHRLVYLAGKVKWINEPLYIYRERQGSIMQSSFSAKRIDDFYAQLDRVKFMQDKTDNLKLKDVMLSRCLNTGRRYFCKIEAEKLCNKEETGKIYKDITETYKIYVKKSTFSIKEKIIWFIFLRMHPLYMLAWKSVSKWKTA